VRVYEFQPMMLHQRQFLLHVAARVNVRWQDFPGRRDMLERWKLIPGGEPGTFEVVRIQRGGAAR
jgi:hypothetical protein